MVDSQTLTVKAIALRRFVRASPKVANSPPTTDLAPTWPVQNAPAYTVAGASLHQWIYSGKMPPACRVVAAVAPGTSAYRTEAGWVGCTGGHVAAILGSGHRVAATPKE
jgi:hypothetical protein